MIASARQMGRKCDIMRTSYALGCAKLWITPYSLPRSALPDAAGALSPSHHTGRTIDNHTCHTGIFRGRLILPERSLDACRTICRRGAGDERGNGPDHRADQPAHNVAAAEECRGSVAGAFGH